MPYLGMQRDNARAVFAEASGSESVFPQRKHHGRSRAEMRLLYLHDTALAEVRAGAVIAGKPQIAIDGHAFIRSDPHEGDPLEIRPHLRLQAASDIRMATHKRQIVIMQPAIAVITLATMLYRPVFIHPLLDFQKGLRAVDILADADFLPHPIPAPVRMKKMEVRGIEIERAICGNPVFSGTQERVIGHDLAHQFMDGAGWYQELGIGPFLQAASIHGLPRRGSEDIQCFFKVGHGVNQIYIATAGRQSAC
jgi:hypothetical protein